MTRLVPDRLRRRWKDRRIARKRFSCSTFMLYLGIEGRYDHLGHHTIYLDEDYCKNLREIEDRHVLSESPSFYVQNACVTDPSLAPPGMSTLYVLVPVTHQHPNVDWAREREAIPRAGAGALAKVGIKDVERRIRFEHMITPADWDRGYEIHRGATFNLAHNLSQMLHLRPRNRFEDLESVYLVGGGTHPGSGLPVIFESARITSRLLVKDLGMPDRPWGPAPGRLGVPCPGRGGVNAVRTVDSLDRDRRCRSDCDAEQAGGPGRRHRRWAGRPGGRVHARRPRVSRPLARAKSLARRQGGRPGRAGLSL